MDVPKDETGKMVEDIIFRYPPNPDSLAMQQKIAQHKRKEMIYAEVPRVLKPPKPNRKQRRTAAAKARKHKS